MVRKSNPKRNADNLRILDRSDNISDTSTIFTSGETTGEKRLVDIAFDISTSCTGICVLDSKTGELVKLG